MDTKASPNWVAKEFRQQLQKVKAAENNVNWYPYDILSNVPNLAGVIPDWMANGLISGFENTRVLDIGAADGDLGYLFASRGCRVDFLDNASTNYNHCEGIKALGAALRIEHDLIERDVDRGFTLERDYDIAICLGLLYHLRNPMLILMELAMHARTMVLSTRVATHFKDGAEMSGKASAYLLGCRESNDDPTNYWIMSPDCLRRILKRSGWIVEAERIIGAEKSNPVDQDADARMYAYCERVPNWRDLGKHHEF